MNSVPVPWFLTPGQKGNRLADTLDSYVNGFPFYRPISTNTFYAPNASVRYDASEKDCKDSSVFGNSMDNSGIYDEDPATRALRLAKDGTSGKWACNQVSPFHAPFEKIHLQRRVEWEYYKAGCVPSTMVLVTFFVILQVGVTLGAISYYINDLPNPCPAIILGALMEWDHSNMLRLPGTIPVAPVIPPAAFVAATAPPLARSITPALESSTATVDVAPNAFTLLLSNLFGNGQNGPSLGTLESRHIQSGIQASACDLSSSLDNLSQVCSGRWSVPSAEWVRADPSAANYVFRGCSATCVKSGMFPTSTGVCTCATPVSLRR